MQDLRRIENAAGHLFAAVRREFGRIFLTFLGGLAVGAGAVEGTAVVVTHTFGETLAHVAAIIFGVVLGYAAALTVAIIETVRALINLLRQTTAEAAKVEQAAVAEAAKIGGGAEGILGNVVKAVEGEIGKIEPKK
jgi:hypothetical protein